MRRSSKTSWFGHGFCTISRELEAQGRGYYFRQVRTWVLYHLQIIGEAAAQLGKAFHAAHPEVPWAQIVAMRNVLVHAYFGVDLNEVWKTVERDLPVLKQQVEALIDSLQPRDSSE